MSSRFAICNLAIVALALLGCQAHTARPRAPLSAIDCPDPTLVRATLYTSPGAPALNDATITIRDGSIERVSQGEPESASPCVLDVGGRVVLAGFWNTHVHFTNPEFAQLDTAAPLIRAMLLQYGFTSVVDTGADPRVIQPLRNAIRDGTLPGPRIVIAGGSFVYEDGTPAYLPKGVLPELAAPEEAPQAVIAALDAGADGIKIFSGSFQSPDHTIYLPPEIIAQVTETAHARGSFVISHPTDRRGLINAVENGVDVLAHTAPPAGRLGDDLIAQMLERRVALTPTLKLWRWELGRHGIPDHVIDDYERSGVNQLRDFHAAGGEILFGTDVGYMDDFDTGDEFRLMARAGLDFAAIAATLTTNPARRFGKTAGTVSPGEPADLVILQDDPQTNLDALAKVAMTIRAGHVVFRQTP